MRSLFVYKGWKMTSKRAAYSLLELTITTMIIGILCAVALPSLQRSTEGRNIEAASRQFFAELQACRSLALRENRRIQIEPTIGRLSFSIRRLSTTGTTLSTEVVNLSSGSTPIAVISTFSAPPNTFIDINHLGEINGPTGNVSQLTTGSIAFINFTSGTQTKTVQISHSLTPLP